MARKPRILFAGAIYHITFRGNARQDIFLDVRDRRHLLDKVKEYSETYQSRIFLYCLMTNHVHLLVQTPLANLDRFMGALLTSHSVYFNRRHERSGHLMQGRYDGQLVSGDSYLLNLSRYIHLNPVCTDYWAKRSVRERADFLMRYPWSSYRAYIGLATAPEWLNTNPLLAGFESRAGQDAPSAYRQFVETGMAESDVDFKALLKGKPIAIGPPAFVDRMRELYAKSVGTRIQSEDAVLRVSKSFRKPDDVFSAVQQVTGLTTEGLNHRIQAGPARALLAWALQKYAGQTQRDVAGRLGLTTGAAVSALIHRHAHRPEVKSWKEQLHAAIRVSP